MSRASGLPIPQTSICPPAPGRSVVTAEGKDLAVQLSQINAATHEAAAALESITATLTKLNAIATIVAEHGVVAAAIARSAEQTVSWAAQTPSGLRAEKAATAPSPSTTQDFGAQARMVNEAFARFVLGVQAV